MAPDHGRHGLGAATVNGASLADLTPGQMATVTALDGGCGFVTRMAALGFAPGAEVRSVRNAGHGPMIVAVLGSEVALGRGQAMHVHVHVG